MTKRRTITARMAKDIILRQVSDGLCDMWPVVEPKIGCVICPLCRHGISITSKTIYEHMQPLALGGDDDISNLRIVHKECADKKTRGTGATTSGSDIGEIAKTRRLERARIALTDGIPKQKKAKKIQSRGFDKKSRPFPKGKKHRLGIQGDKIG